MRKLLIFISFILFASLSSAQIYDPVTWDFSYEKKSDKQYELIFTATIDKEFSYICYGYSCRRSNTHIFQVRYSARI